MPVFKKISGAWTEATHGGYVKQGGLWKETPTAHVKVPSVGWKVVNIGRRIPEGIIFFYNADGSAPAGWEIWNTANDRYLLGASSTISAGQTGGSDTVDLTLASAGLHTGHGAKFYAHHINHTAQAFYPTNWAPLDSSGTHTHTASLTWRPARKRLRLIRATSDRGSLPANTVVLSHTALSLLSEVSDTTDRYMLPSLTRGDDASQVVLGDTAYAGDHTHTSPQPANTVATYRWGNNSATAGSHRHPVGDATVTAFTDSLYKAMLRAWTGATGEIKVAPGMIGMWLSTSSIPDSWHLCDGTNGTPDLRNRFVGIKSTYGLSGSGVLSITGNYAAMAWDHNHQAINPFQTFNTSVFHTTNSTTHGHGFSASASHTALPFYGVGFIMKAS